jgi:hypothetical protein
LNDEEIVESFSNFLGLFTEYFSMKTDEERFTLDPIFMEYLKNSLSAFVNSLNLVLIYSNDPKIKLNALKGFHKILARKSKKFLTLTL